MANITKITALDGTTYDIRDAQARMYGVHYVEGDTNDTAGTWTGTLENLTAYYNGLTIIYVPKVAGASTTTLNLNDIGAITCYTTNTTKLDTQYTANTPILFTYQDGYWRRADNDVNTTTISNLYNHYANYVADSAIYRYQILFERTEDKLTPLTNANNDTGTSKTMLTSVEFNAFGRIFYYVSATAVEANGSVSAGSLCFAHESFNARYTFNCGTTLTAHKNFYLVVTPTTGNMCTIASSSPWAQELPSTNDGNWYILIGRAYSTYQVSLYPLHPVYMYDGTKVIQVMPNGFTASSMIGATSSADGASGLVPKPVTGDNTKFLRGDGTWQTVSGGGGANIDDTAGAGDTDKAWSADKLTTEFGGKADKVSNATNNHFAALDSNGNLKDSGKKASDFASSSIVITDNGIVVNGNTSTSNIKKGNYVTVKNSTISGISNGLYISKANITAGTAVTSGNLTSVSIGGLNSLVDMIYPVGSIYMSFNSTMPAYLTAGKTWTAITAGYVLKTVTSGTGGDLTAAGKTGGTTLTVDQIPSHTHVYGDYWNLSAGSDKKAVAWNSITTNQGGKTIATGGGGSHNHTAGMPANVAIYMWQRTA